MSDKTVFGFPIVEVDEAKLRNTPVEVGEYPQSTAQRNVPDYVEPARLTLIQLRVELAKLRDLFQVYKYDKGFSGDEYWMLWAPSEFGGAWSDIHRYSETDCWQFEDMLAAAPPVEENAEAAHLMMDELSCYDVSKWAHVDFDHDMPTPRFSCVITPGVSDFIRGHETSPVTKVASNPALAMSLAYYHWKTGQRVELVCDDE